MARKKTGTKYDTIKIPEGLTSKIDELIKLNPDFTSRTDVIKYAVRLFYESKKKV
jgi:Arc/MetJ-type ribon-helix-helix transcriptional regulator